jgi:hypothetical protein
VRQDTFGKLPDVPVPRKMNSMAEDRTESERVGLSDIIGSRVDINVDRKKFPTFLGYREPNK